MRLGFIGLGKMGNRMVIKLLTDGHEVVVWNRSEEKVANLKTELSTNKEALSNLDSVNIFSDFTTKLEKPRIVWSMLPAGEATEAILFGEDGVVKSLEPGDILVDGGNANFHDSQRRFENLKNMQIKFLGIGVSGGIVAFEEGYPLMIGGDKSAYEEIAPILDSLAHPNGAHQYFGEGGAGHFVKMVHNAIEYGYMQSIGEGFGVLEKSPYNLDLVKVSKLYQAGSLVSGFMMQRTIEVLEKDPSLSKIEGIIGKASGETVWTVDEAKKQDLPIDVILRSLEIRNESETDTKRQSSFAAKMVAALRNAFGGHEVISKIVDTNDSKSNN